MIMNQIVSGGGTTPTGTKSITSNGIHDVAGYANADVQVPTTAPSRYIAFEVDGSGWLQRSNSTPLMDFTGVKQFQQSYMLANVYYDNTNISGPVDMSSVEGIGYYTCDHTFYRCTGLTSVDLSSLKSVGISGCADMFYGCTGLTSANLSSLEQVTQTNGCNSMFYDCSALANVDISSLTLVTGNTALTLMFADTSLVTVKFSSLTSITGLNSMSNTFSNCTNLTSLWFPSITPASFGSRTGQLSTMCSGVPNVTLHFPSNSQAKVETLGGYSATAPFGAVSGTVLFDLPKTVTLTGADTIEYTRNPKYDTATALAWKVGAYGTTNFTPEYYTSGTTDPAVSDTIYSDAACTTTVTTISSIA